MRTVLVTGANRGIGFEICRQLDELGFQVILTSRNLEKGLKAAESLSKNVIVKQLDVTNDESIAKLLKFVNLEIGKLDVLINNAGLGNASQNNPVISGIKSKLHKNFNGLYQLVKMASPLLKKVGAISQSPGVGSVLLNDVKTIMDTNFYGPWRMIQVFAPLLTKSDDGRIINISSGMGELKSLTGLYPGYSLSKASLNALTIMFSNELKGSSVKVNAMCPGWVKTDMGGPDAPKSVMEGADTAVWLITEQQIPTGKFFKDRQEISW